MSASSKSTGLKLYGARPYESDGGFSVQGLLLTTGVGVAVAVVMGVVAGFVGQFFYAVIIFPMAIGLAVGAAQIWAIRYTKIRTPLACGAAGVVAGVVAATTMHYFNYVSFNQEMSEVALEEQAMRQDLAATPDALERQYLQALLAEYEADDEIAAAKRVSSFTSYLDWSAHQGVEISPGHRSSSGLNLGYTGTWVYWGIEAVIVALISAAVARRRASAPFCVKCDQWKIERELGSFQAAPKVVGELVQAGRLVDLPAMAGTAGGEVAISVCECPSCASEEEVVLQVDQVTYNNGSRTKSPAARAIYPRGAVEELIRYFGEAAVEGRETGELVGATS